MVEKKKAVQAVQMGGRSCGKTAAANLAAEQERQSVQQMSSQAGQMKAEGREIGEGTLKAVEGVERARQAAERGELIDKRGNRMNPASLANLRPGTSIKDMKPEEKREFQQAGARASAESQAKRRTIRDIYNDLLSQPDDISSLPDAELAERVQKMAQQKGRAVTVYESIAAAMAAKAKAGDVKAAVFVRDSAGDKPVEQMEISTETVTDADRELMQNIQKRLQNSDKTSF